MLQSPSTYSSIKRMKQLTYALLTVAILVLVAGGAGAYLVNAQCVSAQAVVDQKERIVDDNQEIAARYQDTLNNYNSTSTKLSFLEGAVSQNTYVPTLVQQIQHLATSTKLTVATIRPGSIVAPPAAPAPVPGSTPAAAPAPPVPYSTMTITLDVAGTYPQIMSFVYSLPKFPKIVSVQSITLHPGAPGNGEPSLTAEISLSAYVFDQDATTDTTKSASSAETELGSTTAGGPGIAALANHRGYLGSAGRTVAMSRTESSVADSHLKDAGLSSERTAPSTMPLAGSR
jgi:Tfp pilus assembly protein PilO